jgi:hypothetical protein
MRDETTALRGTVPSGGGPGNGPVRGTALPGRGPAPGPVLDAVLPGGLADVTGIPLGDLGSSGQSRLADAARRIMSRGGDCW